MNIIKINQGMSEFLLAQALKELSKIILGTAHVDNTSRNKIAEFNEKLAEKLEVETNPNKSLTNLIKDFIKIIRSYESITITPMSNVDVPVFDIEEETYATDDVIEDVIEYDQEEDNID